jgi:hypothetical protein
VMEEVFGITFRFLVLVGQVRFLFHLIMMTWFFSLQNHIIKNYKSLLKQHC